MVIDKKNKKGNDEVRESFSFIYYFYWVETIQPLPPLCPVIDTSKYVT